jgi:hypothetical protein
MGILELADRFGKREDLRQHQIKILILILSTKIIPFLDDKPL